MTSDIGVLIPASTVVLVRDSNEGLQTLLLRRNSKLDFAGGNWVFPGGRIDDEDYHAGPDDDQDNSTLEEGCGRPVGEFAAAKYAAVRETREEADLAVDSTKLVYFAHWVAPPLMKKRFSTWFFISSIELADSDDVTIDGGEIHESRWIAPGDALALAEKKEITVLPPTMVTLTELAKYNRATELLDYYRQRSAVVFRPHPFIGEKGTAHEGRFVFLYGGDAGYSDTNPDVDGARHRLSLDDGHWRYENTVYD